MDMSGNDAAPAAVPKLDTGEGTGDTIGHGTHCAETIASSDAVFRGVAPGCTIHDYKTLVSTLVPVITMASIAITGIQQVVTDAPDVLSNSWGFTHVNDYWTCPDGNCIVRTAANGAVDIRGYQGQGSRREGTTDMSGDDAAPTAVSKLDRHLRALIESAAGKDDVVPVVIRVRHGAQGGAPAEKAQDFKRRMAAFAQRLSALGATITGYLWIASSLAVRIPISALTEAAADEEVEQIISDHMRRAL
jgi:subtilisin family serine protease